MVAELSRRPTETDPQLPGTRSGTTRDVRDSREARTRWRRMDQDIVGKGLPTCGEAGGRRVAVGGNENARNLAVPGVNRSDEKAVRQIE